MSQGYELWIVFKELVTMVAVILIFRRPKNLNSKHLQGMYGLTVLEDTHQAVLTHGAKHDPHVRCW